MMVRETIMTPDLEQTRKRARKNARARVRNAGVKIETALAEVYKPIEEWDMEELAKGRPRAIDGTFKGGGPAWVTPAIRDEAKRRFQTLGRGMLQDHLVAAVKVISDLATNDDVIEDDRGRETPAVPASVRLQAAIYLIDQVLGKATARVEVEAGDSLRDVLASSLVLPGGAAATIIEGELADADDSDEEL